MKVLFCHGLESGPHGSKYQALVKAGYDVLAPDCTGVRTLSARMTIVTPLIKEHQPLVVGSSFGGITAILSALAAEATLPGMILCAPALRLASWVDEYPLPFPVTIIHGTKDDVVPIEGSRAYAAKTGARLIEVDDGHRLHESEQVILDALRQIA